MNPVWQIELFGGLRGRSETGAEFAPGVSRSGTLFAVIAIAPSRAASRDTLAALLWPEVDTSSGRTRLRQELSILRRQLEPEGVPEGAVLTRERDRIALVPGAVITDVEQFQKALDAAHKTGDADEKGRLLDVVVALYRGELLPGYEFEGLEGERAHLTQRYEMALRELAALQQARGDVAGAEACLRKLLTQNPYLEEAHADLMCLYAAHGQPTRVREQYRELERMLRKEFDTEPTDATRQLMERLSQEAVAVVRVAVPAIVAPAADLPVNLGVPATVVSPVSASVLNQNVESKRENGKSSYRRYAIGFAVLLIGLCVFDIYRTVAHSQGHQSHSVILPGSPAPLSKPIHKASVAPVNSKPLSSVPFVLPLTEDFLSAQSEDTSPETRIWLPPRGSLPPEPVQERNMSAVSVAPKSTPLPLQWREEEWTYKYKLRPGEAGGSEPKAMIMSGPNIVVTGLIQTEKEDPDILTVKLSPQGKLLWADRYSGPEHDCDRAFSLCDDAQDGVYVAGESYIPAGHGIAEGWRLVVLRYDANGKLLWARRSRNVIRNEAKAIQVIANPEGCWVGGTALVNEVPHVLVLHYDNKGNLQWEQTAREESAFSAMTNTKDIVYVCGTGVRHDNLGTYSHWYVGCFGPHGERQWEQKVEGPGKGGSPHAIFSNVSGVVIGGIFQTGGIGEGGHGLNFGLAHLSCENGRIEWMRYEATNALTLVFTAMGPPGSSIRMIGTRTTLDGQQQIAVSSYDADGELIYSRQFPPPGGYSNIRACATAGLIEGVLLPQGREAEGDLLMLDLDNIGAPVYAVATRATGIGFHDPRAVVRSPEGFAYVAAWSFYPEHPTLTITKMSLHF